MQGDLYINDYKLSDTAGSLQFRPGWIDFEVTDRTIDNTLVSDFVGFKRIFNISWENWLDGALVEYLVDLYNLKEDVTFKVHEVDTTVSEYTCRLSISENYNRESKIGNFAYSNFSITLEEV